MKKFYSLLIVLMVLTLNNGCNQSPEPVYTADWESIKSYQIPEWFKDAKLGIFIHWGAYSVPAYGSEWYPRLMYQDSVQWNPGGELTQSTPSAVNLHHLETYGEDFGYKDFIPMFKAEKFDAGEWLRLFKKAGARYIVPVAEHHDAFAMYNSSLSDWNSVKMGPKRDILAELKAAAKEEGLYFGASSHFAYNWVFFNKKKGFDTVDPEYADLYGKNMNGYVPADQEFLDLWWARTTEIIDKYQPDIFWFDFFIDNEEFVPYHPKLAAYYYNKGVEWDREVVLQTKNFDFASFPAGSNVLDIERGKLSKIRKFFWQTDTSIGENSWGYVQNWISKSPNTLIDDLIDIVSKNGSMLLNVGPTSEGIIPEDQQQVLLEMGEWLALNGEGIYETRPWSTFGEGPTIVEEGHHSEGGNEAMTAQDIRFTKKGDVLYVFCLDIPKNPEVLIKSINSSAQISAESIKSVQLMGSDQVVKWEMSEEGLKLEMEEIPAGLKYAIAFKIELKS